MKRMVLLLTMVVATMMSVQAQPLAITKSDGSKIFYDNNLTFLPQVVDGKPVWQFLGIARDEHGGDLLDEHGVALGYEVRFTIDNVEDIKLPQADEEAEGQRQALMELYQEMNGDNWIHNDYWGTEWPIRKWYGNQYNESFINHLYLHENNLQGSFPSSLEKMPFLASLWLHDNQITGELPAYLANMYSLKWLSLSGNQLSGTIPEKIVELPFLHDFSLGSNNYSGPFPESIILKLMDRRLHEGVYFNLNGNDFSGKVPDAIKNHPAFVDEWPCILIQNGHVDLSDVTLKAPVFDCTDINGNTFNLADVYSSHKYTLLYDWGWWCPWSELFNQQLLPAYEAYKDKGFEVIAINYTEDEGLASYVKEHNIPWVNVRGDIGHNYDGAVFSFSYTPYYYLVDQKGNIVYTSVMDDTGKGHRDTDYRNSLFPYLEKAMGKAEYDYYTSTDYSKDGEVMTLQTATAGQGVDIVFVGEGFVDKDMDEGGKYEQRMNEAMEQFFAYEPLKSLRNRFNVYTVKAVSPNAEFLDGAKHAIEEKDAKAFEYAQKVTTLIPNCPLHVNVIYSSFSGGRDVTWMYDDNSYVAYMMDGVSMALNHEAGGHGLGRLLDEYVEPGNESLSLPEEKKTEADAVWTSNGRGANIDWRSDPTQVKWAKFMNDTRYASEGLGLYEGSWLYAYGAYRPTQNSMMRFNDCPFNAPSREAIYKYVMQESEGSEWTYDYETFVAFDEAGRAEFVNALNSSARQKAPRKGVKKAPQLSAPPVFVKGTWRDALKKR